MNFVLLAGIGYFATSIKDTRKLVSTLMVFIWGLRLGSYLFYRVMVRGKDDRFDKIRINPVRFFIFFIIQALWVWIVSLPVTLLNHSTQSPKVGLFDYIGWVLWTIGFLYEAIADQQKYIFNSNPENKNKVLKTGLYKFSRYPNYFGEILLWFGLFLSSTSALSFSESLVSSISPLFTYLLLRYVSGVKLTDIRYNQRFKEDPEWLEYKAKTNIFIPKL